MKKLVKKYKGLLIIAVAVVVVTVGLFAAFMITTNPYSGSILRRTLHGVEFTCDNYYCADPLSTVTKDQALEDLEFAYKYFKRVHPITYKGVPKELAGKYEEAKAVILSKDEITVNQLCALVESFISPIGDGHSYAMVVFADGHYMYHFFPEGALGIEKVNGETVENILIRNSAKFSYETHQGGIDKCYDHLVALEGLDYIEIDINKPITYTFLMKDGSCTDVTITRDDFLPIEQSKKLMKWSDEGETPQEELPFVYYNIYEDLSLAVLTLDSCEANDLYNDTLKAMFTEVKQKNICNVCVDLRENGGGSSYVTDLFLRYCDVDSFKGWPSEVRENWLLIKNKGDVHKNKKHKDLLFTGAIYLLTSHDTYSAAKDFAMVIKDNGIGTLIGEASGNNPNSYGDSVLFLLPNSRLLLSYSYKKWYRIDYKEGFIEPDISCDSEEALEKLKGLLSKAD